MLIRFEVGNFRSVDAPVEISMVAIDRDRPSARNREALGESLVTVAGIYGPNASGKSSLVKAISWLQDAVLHSLRVWEDSIPVDTFAFTDDPEGPTTFAIDLESAGVRYEYQLEVTADAVLYEALFEYPANRARRVFEREHGELKVQRGAGPLGSVHELLTDRTLALSLMRRFDVAAVAPVVEAFRRLQVHGLLRTSLRYNGRRLSEARALFDTAARRSLTEDDGEALGARRNRALALLRLADLGVDDVVYPDAQGAADTRQRAFPHPTLVHRIGVNHLPLEFAEESAGTQAWFLLIPDVLAALDHGSIIVFDELDASLHPTLSAELLRLFQDPATNPHGAQLIFTSHDTSLLNELNRDEVWLTEKRPDGSTRLGALSDFAGERVRNSQNLARGYLSGRFGALPDVDRTELLRALGLIG